VTRGAARTLLRGDQELSSDDLADVFGAFGFRSEFEAPNAEIYYHEDFIDCGSYKDKEYIGRVLSDGQRRLVRQMVECVAYNERLRYGHELPGPID